MTVRRRDFVWAGLLALVVSLVAIRAISQTNIVGGLTGAGITPISTAVTATGTYGSVSVGTSATTVVASNTARVSATVYNNGTATIYCGVNSSVVVGSAGTANSGFPLTTGSSRVYDRYTGAIVCISGTAAQDVRYDEFTTS